jgi:hypothetical protein
LSCRVVGLPKFLVQGLTHADAVGFIVSLTLHKESST